MHNPRSTVVSAARARRNPTTTGQRSGGDLAMSRLADQPFLMFVVSFIALCACAWFGALVLSKYAAPAREVREDLRTILAACLTLLGLIVGFSFSMAVSRYDLRKGY